MKAPLRSLSVVGVLCVASYFAGLQGQGVPEKSATAEMLEAAREVWEHETSLQKLGRSSFASLDEEYLWSRRLAEAGAAEGDAQALAEHSKRMRERLVNLSSAVDRGRESRDKLAVAKYYVAEARLILERAQAK